MAEIIDLSKDEPIKVIMLIADDNCDACDGHLHYSFMREDAITPEIKAFLEEIDGHYRTSASDLSDAARDFFCRDAAAVDAVWFGDCTDICVIPEGCVIARVISVEFSADV